MILRREIAHFTHSHKKKYHCNTRNFNSRFHVHFWRNSRFHEWKTIISRITKNLLSPSVTLRISIAIALKNWQASLARVKKRRKSYQNKQRNKKTTKNPASAKDFLFIYPFIYLFIMITISIIFLARAAIPCWFVEWCRFKAIYFPKYILSDKHLNIFGISSSVHKLMLIHAAICCLAIVVWSTDGSTASSDFYPIWRTPIHKHVQVRHQHAWGIQVVSSSSDNGVKLLEHDDVNRHVHLYCIRKRNSECHLAILWFWI